MKDRVREALKASGVTQAKVAEYCGISEQAVARWKATGQVAAHNLFALSELTGFRYVYLKGGTGDERFIAAQDNEREYLDAEGLVDAKRVRAVKSDCGELEALLDAIRRGYFGGRISKGALIGLKALVDSM